MSVRLRLSVPMFWVLIVSLALATASKSSWSVPQLWSADPSLNIQVVNPEVVKDLSAYLVDHCTLTEVSCGDDKMKCLTSEQKKAIKFVYIYAIVIC